MIQILDDQKCSLTCFHSNERTSEVRAPLPRRRGRSCRGATPRRNEISVIISLFHYEITLKSLSLGAQPLVSYPAALLLISKTAPSGSHLLCICSAPLCSAELVSTETSSTAQHPLTRVYITGLRPLLPKLSPPNFSTSFCCTEITQ